MQDKRVYLALFAAIVIAGIVAGINVAALFAVALVGASATTALRTGSFEPFFPGLTRAQSPVTFWIFMALCLITLAGLAVAVALRLMMKM